MIGAAPRRTSMRSTLVRSSVTSDGLKAPPHGTPSTTRRKASGVRGAQTFRAGRYGGAEGHGAIESARALFVLTLDEEEDVEGCRRGGGACRSRDGDWRWARRPRGCRCQKPRRLRRYTLRA